MAFFNTRFWLLVSGTLFTAFTTIGALTTDFTVEARGYWADSLSDREAEIAAVVELVFTFHILALGLVILAIGLLATDPLRARLGVVATAAFFLSQFLSAGTAVQFGYDPGFPPIAFVIVGIPLVTLIACAVRWNSRPLGDA